jgi:ssDNA-binding Zn-finger/Zn-ribbon topoisomerase 1
MLAGCLARGKSIAGYLRMGLVDPAGMASRHRELVAEMTRRGMRHQSPLPAVTVTLGGSVDLSRSLAELRRRCPRCRARIEAAEQSQKPEKPLGERQLACVDCGRELRGAAQRYARLCSRCEEAWRREQQAAYDDFWRRR